MSTSPAASSCLVKIHLSQKYIALVVNFLVANLTYIPCLGHYNASNNVPLRYFGFKAHTICYKGMELSSVELYTLPAPDRDECQENNGGCSQLCTNLIPGFECSCRPGHILHADQSTCVPNANCSGSTTEDFTCSCLTGYEDTTGTGMNCTGRPKAASQSVY